MGKTGRPYLPNIEPLIAAGIDPKTGLPFKYGPVKCQLKEDIKKALRIIDEQDAVGRYIWKNLPMRITSQELERLLYYRGQLCLFYLDTLNEYFVMPYALDGTIDAYGRFNTIHPVPFANGTDEDKNKNKAQADYFKDLKLEVVYSKEQINKDKKQCILLHDYTKQLNQTIVSRQVINDPILDIMAECIPFMRTRLILGTGVKGVRVNDADQQASVSEGSKRLERAALQGEGYVPILGSLDFQELADKSAGTSEEYMVAMQSLDNLRLSTYGIENGGLFEKKQHKLQAEQDLNGNTNGLVLNDGLEIRKNFAELANALFGKNIEVDINPACKPIEQKDEKEGEMTNENEDDSSI